MDNLRITYQQRLEPSPEQARDVRAQAWRYIFDCYARRKSDRPPSDHDDNEDRYSDAEELGSTNREL